MLRYIWIITLTFFFISPEVRASVPAFFIEDNQMIMALLLEDGTLTSNSLEVYRTGNTWYIPLTAFQEALDLAIVVSPALGQAEGFYIEESNIFKLDMGKCQAVSKKEVLPYPCDQVVIFDDEIYVQDSVLEKWFQLHLKINSLSSEIVIASKFKFPKQLRQERREKLDPAFKHEAKLPDGYQEQKLEDKKIGEGSFDQQIIFGKQKNSALSSDYFRHDTSASLEVLGFETKGFLGGERDTITESSLNISKKDPHGQILGPLKARSIEFLDLVTPTVPLIASSTRTRGVLISSFPLNQPNVFSSKDFRGSLPSNWDVELYQNDILISRRQADVATEYEFKDVTLYYGVNRFRLIFYGPQGQRKEQVEVVNVGQQSAAPADSYYRLGVGTKTEDSNSVLTLAQYKFGLSSQLTAGLSYYQDKSSDSQNTIDYGLVDLSGSFSRFYGTLNLAGNSQSGNAAEIIVQAPFDNFVLGMSHAQLSNFKSSLFNKEETRYLQQTNKLNGNFNLYPFLPVRIDAELQENTYDDGTSLTAITQRTSWQIARSYWFNTLTKELTTNPEFSGQLITIFPVEKYEFRTTVDYKKSVAAIAATLEYRLTNKYSYDINVKHTIENAITDFQGTLNRRYQYATLGVELASDTTGNHRIMGLVSYSCTQNPRQNMPSWAPLAQTQFGAASVRVFLDKDYNGKYGEGDVLLPDISLRVNQNDVDETTDKNGEAMLLQLPTHQATDISMSLKSLPDPLYSPAVKGVRLVPRPGQVSQIEFPVVVYGEIDGTVQVDKGKGLRGLRNISVQLRNLSGEIITTIQTEADGYFLFKDLLPGEYKVTLDSASSSLRNVEFEKPEYTVTVSNPDLLVSTFDFRGHTKD